MTQTSRMDNLFEAYGFAASAYERLLVTPTSDAAILSEYEQVCQEIERKIEAAISRLETSRHLDRTGNARAVTSGSGNGRCSHLPAPPTMRHA